jgi:redox-sensitive bicupin YhaK (pirin superfamily)
MTAARQPRVDVRRAGDRFVTRLDWLRSAHAFSFGPHYDPANTSHGVLLVHNDDVVSPGGGFGTHPHRDMEVVTWVLSGELSHEDSTGHRGVVTPGLAQRMTAGRGIRHAERNAGREPVRFVQMWVAPDEAGLDPGYEQREVDVAALQGALVPIASGMPRHATTAAVRIANRSAALHAARLAPGQAVALPEAPYLHLFVARGDVELESSGGLAEGDAVRFTATGGLRVTATSPAELLLWEMHAAL